ncbi:uncharacterized protein TRIADDRAFT_57350 [Trichoplax adhaerens]|uniref:Uncharacterized protein n=1 Tax=Trichoplax adhaerens TaxID=10228 RepID=B3RZ72_TRIAD|nr:hypothetical protein TRIADDRAFT_57350 [Trichoplax adhaerens]EDV23793.1 hypothetical protein TRIADDRAFT_57350 [Trichoplax adhaerens]|eukprot:XP_002113319.1 hypothetical protein TRIADDRAFT_57350 [Trichoplax adhaerens]
MFEIEVSATNILKAARCGRRDVLADLVNKRLDIDFPDKSDYSKSALHKAAEGGDIDAVKLLISYGADLNYRDTLFRATPLLLAASSGKLDVLELLVKRGGDVDIKDAWRRSPWHWAAVNGHTHIINWLFKYYSNLKKRQNINEQKVIEYIADEINSRDWKKRTSLHLAVQGAHEDASKVLLQYGAEVNCYDLERNTPLHIAARKGYNEIVKQLLQYKADETLTDRVCIGIFIGRD